MCVQYEVQAEEEERERERESPFVKNAPAATLHRPTVSTCPPLACAVTVGTTLKSAAFPAASQRTTSPARPSSAVHGEQRRVSMEVPDHEDPRGAGPSSSKDQVQPRQDRTLQSPGGLRGERGEPVRFVAEVLDVSDQALLHPAPGQAEEGRSQGDRLCERTSAKDNSQDAGAPDDLDFFDREGGGPHDCGPREGHGREQSSASGCHGRVQSTGPDGHGREQSTGDDGHDGDGADHAEYAGNPTGDDGGSAELSSGILGDLPDDPNDSDSHGEWRPFGGPEQPERHHGVVVPMKDTRANGIHRAEDGCFYTLLSNGCPGEIPEAFQEGSARIERAIHKSTGESRDLIRWRLQGFAGYLYDEDLDDDFHVSLGNRDKKKLRRSMRELAKERHLKVECRKPVIMEVFGNQNFEKDAASLTSQLDLVCFRQGRNWDFRQWKHRASFWQLVDKFRPELVILDPVLSGVPGRAGHSGERRVDVVNDQAIFDFCVNVAREQLRQGRRFLWEGPHLHGPWVERRLQELNAFNGVAVLKACQCPGESGWTTSTVITNDVGIALAARGSRPESDPEKWNYKVLLGFLDYTEMTGGGLRPAGADNSASTFHEDEEAGVGDDDSPLDQEEEEEGPVPDFPPAEDEEAPPLRSCSDRKAMEAMVQKLHENLGHIPVERLIAVTKAAGAKDEVLDYLKKDFACEICQKRQSQVQRRVAAFPRTYSFNKIVGIDLFYLPWRGLSIPFLNVLCHGSHYQMATMVRPVDGGPPSGGTPSSEEVWKCFMDHWVRPFGVPEVAITDGGPEFERRFARGLEQISTYHHVADSESPWQNGRCERHGGFLKSRAKREIEEGAGVVHTLEDLDLLISHMIICKNNWYSRAGFSPAQLVFGRALRLPEELLSDNLESTPGRQEAAADPSELDGPGQEFQRCNAIRQRAREITFQADSKDRVQRAAKARRHKYQQYTAGQWVYVYRRAPQRSRWSGPGLVLLHSGTTVWVAMRARLWKCNVDQVRPASATEAMGVEVINSEHYQELLKSMQGKRAGAVDVEKEGAPPEDSWQSPVEEVSHPHKLTPRRRRIRLAQGTMRLFKRAPPFQRHASQDSTTVPSESSHHPEAPFPKRSRGGTARPSTIPEDSEVSETSSIPEPASSSTRPTPPPSAAAPSEAPTRLDEVTSSPAAASGEPRPRTRGRSRSPVPPVQRRRPRTSTCKSSENANLPQI